jgi:hypothetical protein
MELALYWLLSDATCYGDARAVRYAVVLSAHHYFPNTALRRLWFQLHLAISTDERIHFWAVPSSVPTLNSPYSNYINCLFEFVDFRSPVPVQKKPNM